MNRIRNFSVTNPTGETPGMEPVRLDVLQAAVQNSAAISAQLPSTQQPVPALAARPSHLVTKTIRLPADLVDYIDFVYTKEQRLKKQDAYTQALDAYFRHRMPSTPA